MKIKEWLDFKSTLKEKKKMKVLVTLGTGISVRMSAIYEKNSDTESYYIYSEGACEELQLFGASPRTIALEFGSSHYCISRKKPKAVITLLEEIQYLRRTADITRISVIKRHKRIIKIRKR